MVDSSMYKYVYILIYLWTILTCIKVVDNKKLHFMMTGIGEFVSIIKDFQLSCTSDDKYHLVDTSNSQ